MKRLLRASLDRPVHLLWSGGWDSTFRLLQLLLLYRQRVRPLYILDRNRRSLSRELLAMEAIRRDLFRDHPFTRRLLAPVRSFELSEVPPNPRIERAYREVKARRDIGDQFAWLPRFLEARGWARVEQALEVGPLAQRILLPEMVRVRRGPFWTFRVAPGRRGAVKDLFGRFDLPLLETSKRVMLEQARKNGWEGIMMKTWFCHRPAADGRPCGFCGPCDSAVQDGLAFRVPTHRIVMGFLYRVLTGRWKSLKIEPIPPRPEGRRVRATPPLGGGA